MPTYEIRDNNELDGELIALISASSEEEAINVAADSGKLSDYSILNLLPGESDHPPISGIAGQNIQFLGVLGEPYDIGGLTVNKKEEDYVG